MRIADYIILSSIMIFALCCALTATPQTGLVATADVLDADGYPRVLAILYGFCFSSIIFYTFIFRRRVTPSEDDPEQKIFTRFGLNRLALLASFIFSFIYGISNIGFIVTTSFFVAISYLFFENWNKAHILKAVVYGISVAVACKLFFRSFDIFLPSTYLF